MSTTTPAAIRDRIIDVIEQLVPTSLTGDRFIRYRNEGDGDFIAWAENYPQSAFRRFHVRDTGTDETPEVTGADVELGAATFEIIVAYPQSHRAGGANALSRDDVIREDLVQLEHAIGQWGAGRFVAPHPEAAWESGDDVVLRGNGVDYLVMRQTMRFWQTVP